MKKIRVLHCVTALNRGGLETLIMNFYRNIDHDKFEFDFLVQREGDFDYSEEIEKLGGKIYSVPAFSPLHIAKYVNAIDEFFKQHATEYNIVHAHNNSFAMYVLRAAQKYGIKVRISHSHIAKNILNLKTPFVIYNKANLKKYCTNQFACGKDAGKWLFGNEDSLVIPNAVDLSKFNYNSKMRDEIRKKYNIEDSTTVIGHVGRFEKQKNHIFLIKLIKYLKDNNIKAKLMLIGEGSLKQQIEKQVIDLHLEKNVLFIGNVNNVYDYLNSMDIFLLPSLFEGLPVTLIEAQANGIQCLVSTNVASESKITSLITFMSLNESVDKWCQTIVKLSKIERQNKMQDIIDAGYEIKTATKELERKYLELIEKNK